ncbi:hypothetical protein ACFL5G_05855 [Candidatus Margulisiibacteriota bacterium]
MNKEKGFILLSLLLIMLCLNTILFSLAKQVIQHKRTIDLYHKQILLQQLSRAGLAYAHYKLKDPGWTTDTAPPNTDQLKSWLLQDLAAGGSNGYLEKLTVGSYKIVKIAGHPQIYSIGFIGATPLLAKYKLVLKEENGRLSSL